jgi:hypothetical protein
MEPAINGHEAIDHNELPVHTWRVARLTRLGIPALLGRRTPPLTPGKPGSRHPRAHGNQAGVAMGPHMRRLPGPGVTAAAQTSSS